MAGNRLICSLDTLSSRMGPLDTLSSKIPDVLVHQRTFSGALLPSQMVELTVRYTYYSFLSSLPLWFVFLNKLRSLFVLLLNSSLKHCMLWLDALMIHLALNNVLQMVQLSWMRYGKKFLLVFIAGLEVHFPYTYALWLFLYQWGHTLL